MHAHERTTAKTVGDWLVTTGVFAGGSFVQSQLLLAQLTVQT